MQTSTFTSLQKQAFQDFKAYPWHEDQVFQAGLATITKGREANQPTLTCNTNKLAGQSDLANKDDVLQAHELLKAKHYYFSRFKQPFELEQFLAYEKELLALESKENKIMAYERMDTYDYENDSKYQNGLPAAIQTWISGQEPHSNWDKEILDQQFLKTKAIYYNSHVEQVDLGGYLIWKRNSQAKSQPACPFANLWKNRGKVAPQEQTTCASFITVEKPPLIGGPTFINLSSPKSKNVLTVKRLDDINKAFKEAIENPKVTSLFFTATVADSATNEPLLDSTPLCTKDTKVVSRGLAYEDTHNAVAANTLYNLQASQDTLEATYHAISLGLYQAEKPMVWFINGDVPRSAAYMYLGNVFVRVITENTLIDLGIRPGHAPFSALGLFQSRLSKAPRPLPRGTGLYLALAPPELGRLRAPELLRLGVADVFVPELRLQETIESAKQMGICPLPDTMKAVQIALLSQHVYSGPDRLGVWEKEIENIFGAAETFDELESSLQKTNNKWSNSILEYWKQLPSILLRVMFRLVHKIKDATLVDLHKIEHDMNTQWRHSKDYQQWLSQECAWEETDEEHVEVYFSSIQTPPAGEKLIYEAPEEKIEIPAACPMSGIKSDAMCPVTGKKSNGSDEGPKCPMSGIKK
ncbi:hypothetical protein CLU79DRAFT_764781 [Phycomyces nitens]|nr:hypothetical protein CLU79DRAFT_764781 [Phycomyces nitens]